MHPVSEVFPALRWVLVAPKGASTALTLFTWFDSMPAGSLRGIALSSDSINANYEELSARGVVFESPPMAQPWGRIEAIFHDPDGNTIVLQQQP